MKKLKQCNRILKLVSEAPDFKNSQEVAMKLGITGKQSKECLRILEETNRVAPRRSGGYVVFNAKPLSELEYRTIK